MASFFYDDTEDLLTGQKVMIDLAKYLMEYCDQVPLTLRPLYFECLTLIFLRGELELNFMGFDTELNDPLQENNLKNNINSNGLNSGAAGAKNMDLKMKVATSYQSLLYHTLQKVLEFLSRGAVNEKEQSFAETFCAIAYFRVPEFRNQLLACLSSSKDASSTNEWKESQWFLELESDESKKNKQIVSFFDWNKHFYSYLKVINLFLTEF